MKERLTKALMQSIGNPTIWLSAIYMLVPTDFIPDGIPVVGSIDDVIILCLCMFVCAFLSTPEQK